MNRRRPRRPGRTHATLGAWCPRRAPVSPFYESFFFCFAPPEKCGPGEGAEDSPRRSRRKWCPRERGRAEEMPAPPAPALAARPGPPPRRDFGGPSPARHWRRRRRQMWPRLPQRANNAGPAKQKGSASPPSRPLTYTLGEPRGIPGRQGPRPQGPRATRAPTCPRRPRSLLPPPPPARLIGARPAAPRYARTPGPQGSGRIVPAARRALVQDRQRPPRAYPPGSRSKPGRLGNRRQTPPPLPSGRRCAPGFSFLFFPNPDGKEGDRLLRIHQLSSQQQKSWRKGRAAGAIGSEGRRAISPPRRASTPERGVRTRGRGR